MPASRSPNPSVGLYAAADAARWVGEADKSPGRTAFERDRARIVHSAGLRRLGAKTQVRTPWRRDDFPVADDFIRTRLTHSLEVAQVGRELGKALGCDPDIVDTACLAHDLGHPPFGHNGERALAEVTDSIGGFEGNAQTLRLLTRLEAKVIDPATGRSVGLNLTRAALDAATKYPWERGLGPGDSNPAKFGVYGSEREVFAWLRQGAPAVARCIEAQVMDFADDVAYSVHDVEDGIVSGEIRSDALTSPKDHLLVLDHALERFAPWAELAELEEASDRLVGLPYWASQWDGSRRTLIGLKEMTSQLIGRFCASAVAQTRRVHGSGALTRYSADLVVPDSTLAEIAVLKALASVFVMDPRNDDPVFAEQRAIVTRLYDRLVEIAPLGLEADFHVDWLDAPDPAARRRVIADQIACLTDSSVLMLHTKYVGLDR